MKTPDLRIILQAGAAWQCLLLAAATFFTWQLPAAPLDFNGDGTTDFAVVRNTGGGPNGAMTWFMVSPGNLTGPIRPTLQRPGAAGNQFPFTFNTQSGTNYAVQFQAHEELLSCYVSLVTC